MFKKNNKIILLPIFILLITLVTYHCNTFAARPTLDLVQTELAAKGYEVVPREIGKSEFGEVFLAKHCGTLVCLKCMFDENFSENEILMFESDKVKLCPNITQTLGVLHLKRTTNSITVLIIEYNLGRTIFEKWSDERGNFNKYDSRQVLKMFIDISHALKALHESGYIHKDIKPQNIMMNGYTYKLIDFGCASPLDGKKDGCGCWAYKAPELILYIDGKVKDYDAKSDVWSLAAMICHLFEGEYPYDCFNYNTKRLLPIETMIENQKLFCEHIPRVEPPVAYFAISRCLVFDPAQRINSSELCNILESSL